MSCIDDLVGIAGPAQVQGRPTLSPACQILAGALQPQLERLLAARNGFYAFESALHVLPAGGTHGLVDLNRWNSPDLWRFKYGDLADGCLFFAEDVFGGQFCIHESEVYSFDSETGKKSWLAHDLEMWADALLGDYQFLTGYPLAHEWQRVHGPLPSGQRLVPHLPFVAGGEFTLENLSPRDAVKGMRWRGDIASQIKDLPEGTQIEIRAKD